MCDVPAQIYTLLDLPYTEWPNFYATGGEIQKYLTHIKKEKNLDRDVQYNSKVVSCVWDGQAGKWQVEVE
jgi:cation diffusion facilitator CzcD-associated flavoprotein CzcO